jgi:hypothetical protein
MQCYEAFENDFKVKVHRGSDKLDDIDFALEGLQLAAVMRAVMEHKYVTISKTKEFQNLLSQSRKSRLILKQEMLTPLDLATLVLCTPNSPAFTDLVMSVVSLITDKSEFKIGEIVRLTTEKFEIKEIVDALEIEEYEVKGYLKGFEFVAQILLILIVETEIATAKSFKDERTARKIEPKLDGLRRYWKMRI